jgi:hypothetical protein
METNVVKRTGEKNEDFLHLYMTGAFYDCTLKVTSSLSTSHKVITLATRLKRLKSENYYRL